LRLRGPCGRVGEGAQDNRNAERATTASGRRSPNVKVSTILVLIPAVAHCHEPERTFGRQPAYLERIT
jgi:hypothetical protein